MSRHISKGPTRASPSYFDTVTFVQRLRPARLCRSQIVIGQNHHSIVDAGERPGGVVDEDELALHAVAHALLT